MKSTDKKSVKKNGMIYAQGRLWTQEQLDNYRRYQTQYRKQHYRTFAIRLNNETDKDVIEFLEKQESLTDTIRTMVLQKLKNTK